MSQSFLLIDGSYYCFYRYYALHTWWKNAKKDIVLDNPYDNKDFVDKFRKTFVDKLLEIKKKLKIKDAITIVAKDCLREKIWRMDIYDKYKANRTYDDSFMGGPFFAMAYGEDLFIKGGAQTILEHPRLEADDCIAITTKHILETRPDAKIYIITSDTDYLQLLEDRVFIYNLKFKPVNETKSYKGDPEKYIFCKILIGDKVDGIPGVFNKCGDKTADKCWEDESFLKEKMKKEDNAIEKFERNRTLMHFNCIPIELIDEFKKESLKINYE